MKKLFLLFTILLISCTNNPLEIRDKGIELFEEDKFEEAIEKFDKCIKINPNDSMAYLWRGKAYFGRVQTFNEDNYLESSFDLNEAIEDFDKAITLVNDPSNIYLRKGHALYVMSDKWNTFHTAAIELGNTFHINELLKYREKCISSLTYFIDKETEIRYQSDSVMVRHLLIQPNEEINIDSARIIIDDLKYMIEEGADFNSLARNYSDDKGSAQYGGDLGWISQGIMVPAFNDACFNANKGDLFIVKTQFGFHLVELIDISKSLHKSIIIKDHQNVTIPLAYLLRGHMYFLLNRYDESLEDFNNCLLLDPENSNAWSKKGFVQYFGFDSKKEACKCWNKGKDFGSESVINAIEEYCSSFFDLKLVRRYNDYSYAHIVLEFKNRSGKHVDKLWLKLELRDKEGNYLAGKKNIHFTNIGVNSSFTEETSWKNINANDIGEIVFSLSYLEVEGVDYDFQNKYFEMMDNKYGIKSHF